MTLRTLFSEVRRSRQQKRVMLKRPPKLPKVSLWSVLTCPNCGCSKLEPIPDSTVKRLYTCTECEAILEPASWECCVYCSYGSVRCAKQQTKAV